MSDGMRRVATWLALIALASVFIVLLRAAEMPAAFLLGPMVAAIVLAVSGARPRLPRFFIIAAQAVLGCLIAAALDDELVHVIAASWEIFVAFSLATIVITAVLAVLVTRTGWLPGTTAIWGLSPGAASAMVLLADEYGADKRMVAMMQYSRIVLVAIAAILLAKVVGLPGLPSQVTTAGNLPPQWFTLPPLMPFLEMLLLAASGIAIAIYSGKASAALFVPAFAGAALQAAGAIHITVPPMLATLAFCAVGVYVGSSFTREVLVHSLRVMPAMLVAILAMILLCGLLSLLFGLLLPGTDPLTAYLAMSPGGIDAAVIIASQASVSLPLILASQFTRLLFVIAGAPTLAKWLARRHQRRMG
ncbi:AbrB family transcriptional regulator [Peristeroidobacter soli]|uniref:AbrB family transcriptional regulator n=1 Tax=Peristeroidobacter soli TaxID=2497877 RepID=UPI001FE27C41|nr:AbrB family transcriptional regulator [Peristeroidobacter soli]